MKRLTKRLRLFEAGFIREYPMARSFHKPQRAHVKQPMPQREQNAAA